MGARPLRRRRLARVLRGHGVQISLLDGDSAVPARPVVLASADPATPTILDFANPPLADSGSEAYPITGIDATIEPGDTIVVTMPEGTVPVTGGANPDWTLLTPDQPTALFQYNGAEPTTIAVGNIVPDVAMLTTAPPTTSSPPTTSPISTSPTPSTSPIPTTL